MLLNKIIYSDHWVQCAIRKLDFIGLFHLFKLFLRYCYEPEDQNQDLFTHTYVPKPNDFSDLSEYFVRKVRRDRIFSCSAPNGIFLTLEFGECDISSTF